MIQERILTTETIKVLVIDEADEMLHEEFETDLKNIVGTLPADVQVGVFSATLPQECLKLASKFLRDPVEILVKTEELTLRGINQFYVDCQEGRHKFSVLKDLYHDISIQQAVIFCNSRRSVDDLTDRMRRENFPVSQTHGSIHPEDRRTIMAEFRKGGSRVLITTDLLARGIDVQQISVVINYDLPREKEIYLHRIGRSGRFGRKGLAINLITPRDNRKIEELNQFYATDIRPLPKNIKEYV